MPYRSIPFSTQVRPYRGSGHTGPYRSVHRSMPFSTQGQYIQVQDIETGSLASTVRAQHTGGPRIMRTGVRITSHTSWLTPHFTEANERRGRGWIEVVRWVNSVHIRQVNTANTPYFTEAKWVSWRRWVTQ